MAVFIYKRPWNLRYVRHNRLTFYRRTLWNLSTSNIYHCVSKAMVVCKKANFCIVASPSCHFSAYSSKRHFLLNKRKIYKSYYVDFQQVFSVFHFRRGESTRPKPNHDLGNLDALNDVVWWDFDRKCHRYLLVLLWRFPFFWRTSWKCIKCDALGK